MQPQIEVVCAVCGSAGHRVICSAEEIAAQLSYLREFHRRRLRLAGEAAEKALSDRAAFTQSYTTEVASCRSCGLVYRESRPPADAITSAYRTDEYGAERLASLFDSQYEIARAKLPRMYEHLAGRPTPAIVEIGSFVGGFLAAAGEIGWRATGVDPGREVGDFCRARGLEILRTTAAEATVPAGAIDGVAIWNTFDQLPDPRPTLAAARRWLRPGGLLVVRVPNGACFRSLVRTLRRGPLNLRSLLLSAMAWNNLLGFPYLWGYSPGPLDRLLSGFGFARVDLHGDTLTRLADAQTRTWARWEEAVLKLGWRATLPLEPGLAPWFDAYYRVVGDSAQS